MMRVNVLSILSKGGDIKMKIEIIQLNEVELTKRGGRNEQGES